ncbi:MAG: hypothetical protein EOP05_11375 [Proteobacteria bacterium]|nr:MAG: hypothetical protein EOP05_11375 [Pseudomonadota bacterium]
MLQVKFSCADLSEILHDNGSRFTLSFDRFTRIKKKFRITQLLKKKLFIILHGSPRSKEISKSKK